ncbi:MAG: DUF262 domain-containing protein [Bacteroidales bacterium]|nr:DUF262 domain-containing protein [Bacteroidales bacterium]
MKSQIIERLITPDGKTINDVFQKKDRYFIDIYQRDYKWERSQVETLLQDIELRFNLTRRNTIDPKKIKEDVIKRFKPYFLNTFLTCKTAGYVSIVDGQQRLTTLLIIFIKLRQLIEEVNNNDEYSTKTISQNVLDRLIFEADDFDKPEYYKIYNANRELAFDAILNDTIDDFQPEDETQKKIIENYSIVSKYFVSFFKSKQDGKKIDDNKLTFYIYYLLEKLNVVEIIIEQQENVATIFEVVNDRGLGLKPYEILKGKFIGNLDNSEKEKANQIWVNLQNRYYNSTVVNSTENNIDLDTFFKIYFRSKFVDSEAEYKKFEDKYHYEIYQNKKILNYFKKFENNGFLFNWVINDFEYYADLHLRIRTEYKNEYLIFNKLLDQNQQYLLIVSAIELNDPLEKEKIDFVAKKFDQMHTALRLLDEYESNSFQDFIYKINHQIRNKSIPEIEKVFDDTLIDYLEREKKITAGNYSTISELIKWELLQNVSNRWTNFSKYVLMRIDRFLAQHLDKPSYCNESLDELEERFNKNNRRRYGMQLEHIYAYNDRNQALFTDDRDVFDEAKFKEIRNKLGMVLLLKDSQNISSNNDYYDLKIDDYATSNIIWNELLVGHIDSVDQRNLPKHLDFTIIEPNGDGVFPLNMVEMRQRELVEILKLIWGF